MAAGDTINLTANLANHAGTLSVVNNDKLEATIVDGKIVLAVKPVAKIGETTYTTLEDAFKAATSGCTIEILSDVTVDYYWDSRYTGAKFTVPVTIDGNDHTLTFTNTVYDGGNYFSAFRFEAEATVKDLTIDMTNAQSGFQGRFRAISAKADLTVEGCTFIGNGSANNTRAIIFGEGAGTNVGNLAISITNSEFQGWRRAISDNENAQDVKTVEITGNTVKDASIYVSATDTVTLTGNTVEDGYVNIKSYTENNTLDVTATGNTLEANGDPSTTNCNKINAGGTIIAQDGFIVPPSGDIQVGYVTDNFNHKGYSAISGEAVKVRAKESFVVKMYKGTTLVGTATLNDPEHVLLNGVSRSISWHAALTNDGDTWWVTEWVGGALKADSVPDRVELWVDGEMTSEGEVKLNNADNSYPVVAAKVDENGVIEKFITAATYIGNADYAAALNTAFAEGGNLVMLRDLQLAAALVVANGTSVTLDLNGKTIAGTDNATGSFGLITNRGTLTIKDSAGEGKITLVATNNRAFNNYSSVLSNTVGGKLIVESGTLEHLGGTDMAYGIDNLTNGKGTYAETVINGGTVKSTYRAIRQFLNGVEAQNILTINDGTIEGTNKSVWMQDPSKNANTGALTIGENAKITGDVYLTVTEGSTEWPVEVSVAAAALDSTSKVLTNQHVPAGYELQLNNGSYGVIKCVASITDAEGNVKNYASLAEAMDAAKAGETVTIFAGDYTGNLTVDEDITVIGETDATGNLVNIIGKLSITADGATVKNLNVTNTSGNAGYVDAKDVLIEGCQVVGSNGFRYCYTTGTVTFKDSTITGSVYGIHFDGGENGNIVIDNCKVTGWTSFAAKLTSVSIADTEFCEGNYNVLRFYQNATVTGSTFPADMRIDAGDGGTGMAGIELKFNDCELANGSDFENALPGSVIATSGVYVDDEKLVRVAKVDGTYYETVTDAIKAAADGDTVQLLAGTISEGTVKMPAALKNVTIKGAADHTSILKDMKIMSCDGNSIAYEGLTFDGIVFDNSNIVITGWRNNGVTLKNLKITNCIFRNIVGANTEAAVHLNLAATEAVNGFTFTNNVIDGVSGGNKSGVYFQATGDVIFTGNKINNVAFRPFVLQTTSDDGVADTVVIEGNTFSGSAAGRLQLLTNNANGTDATKITTTNNVIKGITEAQQICYWNLPANATVNIGNNYYDIDIEANPNKIYVNSAAQNVQDLVDMGVYPIYKELNEDGTIDETSAYSPAMFAKIGDKEYVSLQTAIDAAVAGDVITVIADLADVAVKVTKNVIITADATSKPTLNNVSITIDGTEVELTVSNLKFTGHSYINANNGTALAVDNCEANVTLDSADAVTNSRAAFISLGASELNGHPLKLTITNNTVVVQGNNNPDPVLGWRYVADGSAFENNTFGSETVTNFDAVKLLNVMDGATIVFEGNTAHVWGNGFSFGQNNSRANSYTVVIEDNTFHGDGADFVWVEVSGSSTCKGNVNASSSNSVVVNDTTRAFAASDIKTNVADFTGYAGVDVLLVDGKVIGGTMASFSNPETLAAGMVLDESNTVKLADYIVYPGKDVDADRSVYAAWLSAFGNNTVTDGTNFYKTLKDALLGIHLTGDAVLYCKPGADVGIMTHGHVCDTLTVYGNGARVSGGEQDFEVDTYKYCHNGANACEGITEELTLTVKNLNGAGAWGQRTTAHTINLVFENCEDMGRIYISGTSGVNNITLTDCTFTSNQGGNCKVYSNANGTITVSGCTFSDVSEAINLNHKVAGVQTIVIEDCIFENCGDSNKDYVAPIRVLSSVDGASSVLTVENTTLTGTVANKLGQNADILLDYGAGSTTATVSGTAANVIVELKANEGETTTVAATETKTFEAFAWPFEGAGTEEDPYKIADLDDLKALADMVNKGENFKNTYFVVTANIDLVSEANWTPIGKSGAPFSGIFDGGNYTISNLKASGESHVGLFGLMSGSKAVIKNVKINNATVSGIDRVAALVGLGYTGKIENCHVSGRIEISGNYKVGGISGGDYAAIYNCSVIGDGAATSFIKGEYQKADLEGDCVGGIVGFHAEGSTNLQGCTVSGVTITGTRAVGGLFGKGFRNNVITGCTVTDVVIGTNASVEYATDNAGKLSVGGLAGEFRKDYTGGTLKDCVVKNVTFTNENNVTASIGALTGGWRGSEMADPTIAAFANVSGNEVWTTTITGTNNKYLMVAVADVDGATYYTLYEAVAAANGKTVKLLSDVTVRESVEIAEGNVITLDLNGKTINAAYASGSTTNHVYAFTVNGEMTITGNGVINTRGIFNYGTLTLENGTINAIDGNGGYGVVNYAGATFTMNGGTIATTLEDDNKVDEGGYDATTVRVEAGATFTMNGGEIKNICDFTFAIDNHGTTTIKAGKVSSVHTTVANYGTLIIEGGEFTCDGLEGITAHAVWAAGGTTTIKGGTFDGKDNFNGFNVDASEGAVVNITGGTFLAVHSGSLYGEGTITVSGGIFFDKVPAERCAEGYVPAENADGTYGVKVGTETYGTALNLGNDLAMKFFVEKAALDAAIEALGDGAVVKATIKHGDDVIEIAKADWVVYDKTVNGAELYVFEYRGVHSDQMRDDLTFTIVTEEGQAITEPVTDSVKNYAARMLADVNNPDCTPELRTLLVDMLIYGAEAEAYFSEDETDTAAGLYEAYGLTAELLALASPDQQLGVGDFSCTDDYEKPVEEQKYLYMKTTLLLRNNIDMKLYFQFVGGLPENVTVTALVHGHWMTFDKSALTVSDSEAGIYYITIDQLVLADAFEAVQCMIAVDGKVVLTMSESVESYAYRAIETYPDDASLYNAIMRFAASTDAYLATK